VGRECCDDDLIVSFLRDIPATAAPPCPLRIPAALIAELLSVMGRVHPAFNNVYF